MKRVACPRTARHSIHQHRIGTSARHTAGVLHLRRLGNGENLRQVAVQHRVKTAREGA